MPTDKEISENARRYVKDNGYLIVESLASLREKPPTKYPDTILMAGPPGAGKTEFTQELVEAYEKIDALGKYVLIDPDSIRENFDDYTGTNADLFNGAVSLAVDKVLDRVYKKDQNVIIDGTLSHFDVAEKNIKRALGHGRFVAVFYVYQDPLVAWQFVKKREAVQKRRVSKEAFVEAFINSRINAEKLKEKYTKAIKLHVIVKEDLSPNNKGIKLFRMNVDSLDKILGTQHNKQEIEEILRDE